MMITDFTPCRLATFPDIGDPDQDPMRKVGYPYYPRGGVGFHGLFVRQPLGVWCKSSLTYLVDITYPSGLRPSASFRYNLH